MDLYQYAPLREPDDIRIIRLLPASSLDDDLVADVLPVRLDRANYEALSYAWGSLDFVDRLHLTNGQHLPITRNLASGLRHLRTSKKRRDLWVDALCINQGDEKEKAQQISLMDRVFSRAYRVLVWLGPGDDRNSSAGFPAADVFRLLDGIIYTALGRELDESEKLSWHGLQYYAALYRAGDQLSEKITKMLPALQYMTSQSWFKRAWIVQEAVLPKRLIICWGTCSMNWNQFESILFYIDGISKGSVANYAMRLVHFRARYHFKRSEDISHSGRVYDFATGLLRHMQERPCTLEHDRLFSVLGLLQPPPRMSEIHNIPRFIPDYADPVSAMYTKFAAWRYQHFFDYNMLFDAGLWRQRIGKKNTSSFSLDAGECPSWVPRYDLVEEDAFTLTTPFNPTGYWTTLRWCKPPDLDQGSLSIQATLFDYPRKIFISQRDEDQLLSLWDSLQSFLESQRLGARTTGEQLVAFLRVISLDLGKEVLASQEYVPYLLRLWGFEAKSWKSYFRRAISVSGSEDYSEDLRMIKANLEYWRLFVTNQHRIAFGPRCMSSIDVIAVVDGANVPFLIRPLYDGKGVCYRLVGPCYVHGIMAGEMREPGFPEMPKRKIRLV